MPDLLDSLRRAVHDSSVALIDNQIPGKISDLLTAAVKSGFDIVGSVLTIVKDVTEDPDTP